MIQTILKETIPLYLMEIERSECAFTSMDDIVGYFKGQIENNEIASLIGIFDHYAHTSALPEGQVAKNIRAAVNVIFCFGLTLPDPAQLANRPRSIGICETNESFIISFMEAPMPVANALIEAWTKSLYTPVLEKTA